MAKSSNTRVFELAKQLGVQSKEIVEKCQSEEIPGIKNHMSTVSVGLAETIREWFGDGGGTATAVEPSAPVDVEKVRERAQKRAKRARAAAKKKEAKAEAKAPETKANGDGRATANATAKAEAPKAPEAKAPAPAEPTAAAPEAKPEAKPAAEPKAEATEAAESKAPAAAEATAEAPAAEAADVPAEATEAAEASPASKPQEAPAKTETDADGRRVVMNVPERPDVVKPAAPMLEEPSKTKLSGPKVIRVEAPDHVPAPRPRSERGGPGPIGRRGPRGGAGVLPPDEGRVGRGGGPGAGAGGRTTRRNKRRSGEGGRRTTRTGEGQTGFNWRQQDLLERQQRLNRSGGFFRTHRRDKHQPTGPGQKAATPAQTGGTVKVEVPIVIKDLSAATGVRVADILKKLFLSGTRATINTALDGETAMEVMSDFGIELDVTESKSAKEQIEAQFKEREMADARPRPPVVTILGHVDHGKTSLLDRIRNTNVAAGEAGGITQATSAFRVPVKAGENERTVVFLDTPGHEAFTEMRSRGARVTDVAVLVVAADDGVMPQTVESINHAKAAGVPVIVALNKIDKPEATDANVQRILGQLAEHGLNPVEWGGETEVVRTSAVKGTGVQDLIEMLDYQAELMELKADHDGPAEGTVIEAQMEEGRGPVARLLVQQGKLSRGDFIVIGRAYGRVRDIVDDRGERVQSVGPSTPVAISGIDLVPDAGDRFYAVKSLKEAEAAAEERRQVERQRELATPKVTLDNIFSRLAESEKKELRLIVKADVQGSVETLRKSLSDISTDEIRINVLHAGVGGINESDITLAEASQAIVIGFNVTTSGKAKRLAEQKGIDVRLYDVIYDITDDVTKAAQGLLEPEHRLEVLGHAEVRQVFRVSKVGMVAGCYVTDGVIERNSKIRVTREGIVIEKDRRLEQLKRFKDDVKEVRAGQECGMKIEGYDDIKEGDVLECYKTVEVQRTL